MNFYQHKNQHNLYLRQFLTYLKGHNYSSHTLKNYEIDLNQFLNFLNEEELAIGKLTRNEIRDFLLALDDKKYKSKTIARKLASLKSFIKYLLSEKILTQNPIILMKIPKIRSKLPQFLYANEIELLEKQFDSSKPIDIRDQAIIETLYTTGIRVSELVYFAEKEIDYEQGIIKVLGKGKKERLVFFGERVLKILQRYSILRSKLTTNYHNFFIKKNGKPLRPADVWYIIKKRTRSLPITRNIFPHSLRHSFATHLLDRGADIRSVQALLGHKNLASTQIYTHVSKEKLKKIYEQCHPHGN